MLFFLFKDNSNCLLKQSIRGYIMNAQSAYSNQTSGSFLCFLPLWQIDLYPVAFSECRWLSAVLVPGNTPPPPPPPLSWSGFPDICADLLLSVLSLSLHHDSQLLLLLLQPHSNTLAHILIVVYLYGVTLFPCCFFSEAAIMCVYLE